MKSLALSLLFVPSLAFAGGPTTTQVCHNGNTLNLPLSTALFHVSFHPGDYLGACLAASSSSSSVPPSSSSAPSSSSSVPPVSSSSASSSSETIVLIVLCHNGQDLQVAPAAVAGHLGHGDTLGSCSHSSSSSASSVFSSSSSEGDESSSEESSSLISSSSSQSSDLSESSSSSNSSQTSSWQSSSASSQESSGATSSQDSSSSTSNEDSSESSSSVSSESLPPVDHTDHNGSTEGRGNGGPSGACRASQPFCRDGAKTGQFPFWFLNIAPDHPFFHWDCTFQTRKNGQKKWYCTLKP